jgi:hypothetical protein
MVYAKVLMMVGQTKTKILKVGSRHTIYLEKAFVEDSAFPFKPNEPLIVKIDGERLIIERVSLQNPTEVKKNEGKI